MDEGAHNRDACAGGPDRDIAGGPRAGHGQCRQVRAGRPVAAAAKMAGLDLTQQAKLRQIIHEHLGSTDVYSRIRSFVKDFIETEQGVALEEDKLLSTLHEKVTIIVVRRPALSHS